MLVGLNAFLQWNMMLVQNEADIIATTVPKGGRFYLTNEEIRV